MFNPRTPDVSVSSRKKSSFTPTPRQASRRADGRTPRLNLSVARKTPSQTSTSHSFHVSQIIDDTSQFSINTFGLSLPALITEMLTMSDRSTTEITACIDPSGWAWLVGGRKLFIWRYKMAEHSRCKELVLPASDLAHSAERVCLIPGNQDGQPVACIAVSPEGVVRYWPNVAFESSTAEISAELKGEECAQVINFQPHGCLLATTTSSLLLLEPVFGEASISCKPLKSSQGLFSGISRRMSSFIFGGSQMQANGAPLQAILAAPEDELKEEDEEEEDTRRMFYVLSGSHLNKWQVDSIGYEKFMYQVDVDRFFRELLAQKVWEQDAIQLPHLKTWLLDIQLTRDGLVMLGAGVNLEASQTTHFALAYLNTVGDTQPSNISQFLHLDHTQHYNEHDENAITSFKLLLPDEKSKCVYVYNKTSVLVLQDEILEKMDLKTSGDILLGAGHCDGAAVFFSNVHGIFSVSTPKPNLSILDESNNQMASFSRHEMTSMALDSSKIVEMTESSDYKDKLKGAFISSMNGQLDTCENVLEELFSLADTGVETRESKLDGIVALTSEDIINDHPNADPRWADSDRNDFSTSTVSVIIIQNLRDKQKVHEYFINFLKNSGLWDQLSVASVRGSFMSTRLLLCEHVEKLEAAIALRELHTDYAKLVDLCIKKLLEKKKQKIPGSLTPQDLYYQESLCHKLTKGKYFPSKKIHPVPFSIKFSFQIDSMRHSKKIQMRKVSSMQDLMQVILDHEEESLATDQMSHSILSLIRAVNAIFLAILHFALKYRQSHAVMFSSGNQEIPEYVPWTATTSLRNVIKRQITISLERGIPEAREVDVQGLIFQNVMGLADIVMDGYASQIKSVQCLPHRADDSTQLECQFEKERQALILPLVNHKQYDRAASLAEKYEDFEMLMTICDATNNQERLQRYRTQFVDKGFAQFLFNWYLKEGKRGQLLSQPIAQGEELSHFLDTGNVKYLSWLHELRQANFVAAHHALLDLAKGERNFLGKKKTLLSLSKLSALSAEDEDDTLQDNIDSINDEMDLVLHQELLPSEAVENASMDPDNMRVLAPEELIELYISDKNTNAGELDIKKALDLLRYIDKDGVHSNYDRLKIHIWCRAILMDDWKETDETDPLESNKDRIFFKTIDLVYMDGDLESLLPNLDMLLAASELSGLNKQPHFQFLLKGGYEQIHRALSTME